MARVAIFGILAMMSAVACAGGPTDPPGGPGGGESKPMQIPFEGEDDSEGLPFAQGRTFATLDAYLAFLRERGAYDVPWFQEVRPGVYALISRRGPKAPPLIYTREQLMQRFGFTR